MMSAPVRLSNSSAREVSSVVCSSSAPVLAASSTSCWSSSFDRRASVKVVRSANGFSTTLELAVASHTSGRASQDSASRKREISSAYGSAARSASDFGTSSPSTSDRYEMAATTTTSATSCA